MKRLFKSIKIDYHRMRADGITWFFYLMVA